MLKPAFLLSWMFRVFFKPAFALLPSHRRNQLMTIAHHVKTTLFFGHVMDFSDDSKKVVVGAAAVPSWVVEELYQIADIEPDLYPTPEFLQKFHTYHLPMNDAPGRVYAACRGLVGSICPDIIFVTPWLKRGGADLGVLHHISACAKLGLKAILITTRNEESPWLSRVPHEVTTVELGRLGQELTDAEKIIVLARLVLQIQAPTIHIIQSQLGWETLKAHGKSLLAERRSVFASLYCDDYDSKGQKHGYGRYYLALTLPYLSGIICDSASYRKELIRQYGVDDKRIQTVYFPAPAVYGPNYISSDSGSVIWASRITRQKRPDLLLKIAEAMPDVQFHIKGHAETKEENQIAKRISRLPNVTFTGSYERGGLVEEGNFSLFLYTSAWDGIPNVLLEATMAGLPIVASAVGGVPELINEATGYPVNDFDSVDAYVTAIRKALDDPDERRRRWHRAVNLLQKRHTHERFLQRLAGVNGYFPESIKETTAEWRATA